MNMISLLYLLVVFLLGIGVIQILPFNFSKFTKILIGPSVGIITLTELTLIISLLGGYSIMSIFLSLFVLIVIFLINRLTGGASEGSQTSFHKLVPRVSAGSMKLGLGYASGRTRKILIKNWQITLLSLLICGFVIYIFFTKVLTPDNVSLTTGGGGLWADTAMHSAFTMSIVEQGLTLAPRSLGEVGPQNPLFAGSILRYPFLVNFFSSMLVVLGMNLRFSFILPQIIFFIAFLGLFLSLATTLFNKRTAIFALLIFLFGYGLGFTTYIQDSFHSGSWQISREYTNNHGIFNMHNALTGLIFPERSLLPGLVIGLLITYLAIQQFNNRTMKQSKSLKDPFTTHNLQPTTYNNQHLTHRSPLYALRFTLTALLLGILPLWHTHTFIFFTVAVVIWLGLPILFERSENFPYLSFPSSLLSFPSSLLSFPRRRESRETSHFASLPRRIQSVCLTFLIGFLISLPQLLWLTSRVHEGGFLHLTPGWTGAKDNFLWFWFLNTGLLIPLALIGFWKSKQKLFFLPAFVVFILANIVMFSPWDWDNIKLFTWVFLFLSILSGFALNQILSSSKIFLIKIIKVITVITIMVSLTFSGILSNIDLFKTTYTLYDNDDQALALWAQKNTAKNAVFLIDPYPNHPIPGLSGRSAYMGYPGQLWVHGISYGQREKLVKEVLNGNLDALTKAEVQIDYIVTPQTTSRWPDGLLEDEPNLKKVYENPKFTVFKILKLL